MQISVAWEGKSLYNSPRKLNTNIDTFSTMVWAIDLDDGTLIDALGENIGRRKEEIANISQILNCFGTGNLRDEL